MKATFTTILVLVSIYCFGQKKVLDHPDFDIWNTIEGKSVSPDGKYIMYSLEMGEKDNFLKIQNSTAKLLFEYERSEKGYFSHDSKFALFTIKAWADSVKELKRMKIKKDKMPKDTLAIYNLTTNTLTKIPNLKSYSLPEKWSGYVAYQLDELSAEKAKKDDADKSSEKEPSKKKKAKKVGKENGYHLVVRNLSTDAQDTFKYVTSFVFAEEGKRLAFASSGVDSTFTAGVYTLNLENDTVQRVFGADKGTFCQLSLSKSGKNLGFVADLDTTKALIRPNELYLWSDGSNQATKIADSGSAPQGYMVSADGKISFADDESKMYFGLALPPIVKDTTLLDEEIVSVEVWTYNEPRLYTVQELDLEADQKRSYVAAVQLTKANKIVQLASKEYPNIRLTDDGNGTYALVSTSLPYEIASQWQGASAYDYAVVNTESGISKLALKEIRGRIYMSPAAKFVFGYDEVDSAWFTYSIKDEKITKLTKNKTFFDELNDSPDFPSSYGFAGWTENDEAVIIYDRYDLWQFNPTSGDAKRLTMGRVAKTSFRYVQLDEDEHFLNMKAKWLLMTFNEVNKQSGYYELNAKSGKGKQLVEGPYRYSRPAKTLMSDKVIYTRESFVDFPDIWMADLGFKTQTKISTANPQQADYNWGTAEIVKWTSLDGVPLEGLLIKPENFDPHKKYPLIVNFYERSSDGLYGHRAPSPGRSTINYSFYTSRGYVIFNPDIVYKIGYPGESAYNSIIPGITSLIEKGYIDKENIGVQGHSWGGYQIAYLVTRTNIFKAAEAGAPVPNMISAYGGIRWWTGLSRQFQYEHTQSRIGGTPWDYPLRYIENSPIFFVDKINTPLLIMSNDADGHVPWYQGIEFFTALRRLGKPSWFLNYNGEPHWPLKLQNRKDFNIRMAQFFDYFLQGAPMPVWMEHGVPAIEKGINQGYELIEEK